LFCIKALNNPGGGAERVLTSITSGLVERGHQVAVLTFDAPGGESFYSLNRSIERIDLGLGATDEPSNLRITLRRVAAMRSAVQKWAPDVVIAFMHSMFVPLGLALLGLRVPLIASEHTNFQHYAQKRLQTLLLWLVPAFADLITCVSEQVRQTYPPHIRDRMIVIPNPITLRVDAIADTVAYSRQRKLLLSVGRLDAGKDHATLIEAFARLAHRAPDWDLRIVGDGVLRQKLTEQIIVLGLAGRISLPGAVKDITKEYLNAQLFVTPSRYESFSLTTAEALAHRLPVVGFLDCSAVAQWIECEKNGVLIDPTLGRIDALAAALLPLMICPERRAKLSGGSKAFGGYGLERVIDKWEDAINSASHHKPRRIGSQSQEFRHN
jgi:glycosyltransferase involved in cell wall biosynthesis